MNLQEAFEHYRQESAAISEQIFRLLAPQSDRTVSVVDQRRRHEQMARLVTRQTDAMKLLLAVRGLGIPRREVQKTPEGSSAPLKTPANAGSAQSWHLQESEPTIASSRLAFCPGSAPGVADQGPVADANIGSSEDVTGTASNDGQGSSWDGGERPPRRTAADQDQRHPRRPDAWIGRSSPIENAEIGAQFTGQEEMTRIGRAVVDDSEPVALNIVQRRQEEAARLQETQFRPLGSERKPDVPKIEPQAQNTSENRSALSDVVDAPPPLEAERRPQAEAFLSKPTGATDIATALPQADEPAPERVEAAVEPEHDGEFGSFSETDDPDQFDGRGLEEAAIPWMVMAEVQSQASSGQDDELIKSAPSNLEARPLLAHDLAHGVAEWWNDNGSRDEPFLLNRTKNANPLADVKSEQALLQYDWCMLAAKCEMANGAEDTLLAELAGAFNAVFGSSHLAADVSGALSFVDCTFPDLDYDFRNKNGHWAMNLGAHECRNVHDLTIAIYGAACLVLAARRKALEKC